MTAARRQTVTHPGDVEPAISPRPRIAKEHAAHHPTAVHDHHRRLEAAFDDPLPLHVAPWSGRVRLAVLAGSTVAAWGVVIGGVVAAFSLL